MKLSRIQNGSTRTGAAPKPRPLERLRSLGAFQMAMTAHAASRTIVIVLLLALAGVTPSAGAAPSALMEPSAGTLRYPSPESAVFDSLPLATPEDLLGGGWATQVAICSNYSTWWSEPMSRRKMCPRRMMRAWNICGRTPSGQRGFSRRDVGANGRTIHSN